MAETVDPNQAIKAYRGENLIKGLGQLLGPEEAAGGWYGYTPNKAKRYPFDKAPGILGGAVTRSMEVSPEDVIEASRRSQYIHADSVKAINIENGMPREQAEDRYFRTLNMVDDWHQDKINKLKLGELPQDDFNFMLKSTMQEGVYPEGQRGKIDIAETFKRGNVGIAGATAGARALPYLLKGAGIAALPLDLIAGANQTGLDPQEEVAQAYGIDPSVFYQMDPEQFGEIKQNYDMMVAKMRDQQMADAQTISPMVP